MSASDDGRPAFPIPGKVYHYDEGSFKDEDYAGMTLREYAAIKLCVPDSRTDWLDEMIRARLRDEFAGKAMQGLCAGSEHLDRIGSFANAGALSYEMADAMTAARDAK